MLRWKFQWAKLDITLRYISPNQDLKFTIQRLMKGVTRNATFDSVFDLKLSLCMELCGVSGTSSRCEHLPNLDPKLRFQPQLSADGDVVRSHPRRDGADGPRKPHRGVERSGRWDVHLRRLGRQPGPRCCGGAWKVLNPKTAGAVLRLRERPAFL